MGRALYFTLVSAVLACGTVPKGQQSLKENFPVLYSCDHVMGSGAKAGTYSGFYEAEFESSSFKLSKIPCEVWLTGEVCPIFGTGKCVTGAEIKAYITVAGVLSEPGHFGHFGMWERELRVTRVIKVQRIGE